MKGNRVFAVLGVAILLGLAASYMVWRVIDRPVALQASDRPSDLIKVVAAAVDLPVGTLLAEEKLTLVSVGADNLPPGYFTDKQKVLNRGVVVPMVANEVMLDSKLAPEGAGAGLPTVIPEGMRGVSVKVDEVIGVAGFVLPGTRVDVLVTVDPDEATGDISITKLVLQNVQVLAAGESIQRDAEGKPQKVTVITLLVTPEDAEKLTLASTEGQIQLALRNMLDQDSVDTKGTSIRGLVDVQPTVPVVKEGPPRQVILRPAPTRPTTSVEMYRGTEKEVNSFSSAAPAPKDSAR